MASITVGVSFVCIFAREVCISHYILIVYDEMSLLELCDPIFCCCRILRSMIVLSLGNSNWVKTNLCHNATTQSLCKEQEIIPKQHFSQKNFWKKKVYSKFSFKRISNLINDFSDWIILCTCDPQETALKKMYIITWISFPKPTNKHKNAWQ